MATPNTPFIPSKDSQESLIKYYNTCLQQLTTDPLWRSRLKHLDLAYNREQDKTTEHVRAKIANRYGDADRLQNVTIPLVMPQVESAVTYQVSVFLQGLPIFGVVSNPDNIEAAKQMEAIIENESIKGGWVRELTLMFRDAFKYNYGIIECDWERKTVPAFETDLSKNLTQASIKTVDWEGNVLKRWNPYNSFIDTRVAPAELSEFGEFAGHTVRRSRTWLKSFIQSLPSHIISNVKAAFESQAVGQAGADSDAYYEPDLNPLKTRESANERGTNWGSWFGAGNSEQKIKYANQYDVTTFYARILPSEMGMQVPAPNTPQIWKFIVINHSVVLYAERQTNAHDRIPVFICQPNEDGHGFHTKSLAANVEPLQQLGSAMWNSVIAARRRAVSDRGLYDPSRVSEAHINAVNPSAKIPVRPSAYGKPLSEAYYPIPFRDDQSGLLMQEVAQLNNMANMVTGQNPARQGQFVKGNKTLHEFSSVMNNANGRDQTIAIFIEAQVFTPLKDVIRYNILQYQGTEAIYSRVQEKVVNVDPETLRKNVLEFKITDGLVPADKVLSMDAFQASIQMIASNPQINSEYNFAPMFSYLMKTQGADLKPFEKSPEQKAYEQALMAWQQAVAGGIEAGVAVEKLPPQPQPQQYGYTPGQTVGAPQGKIEQRTAVNNITNNIQNIEG